MNEDPEIKYAPEQPVKWWVEDATGKRWFVYTVDAYEIVASGGRYLSGPKAEVQAMTQEGEVNNASDEATPGSAPGTTSQPATAKSSRS